MTTSKELLRLCGYKQNSSSLHRVQQIKKNYSEFDKIVVALLDLESYLQHSDFYLSLKDDFDLIEIRNDLFRKLVDRLIGEENISVEREYRIKN